MIGKTTKGKDMAKFEKVDMIALPVPVYNNVINFLQEIPYKTVAGLLQQIAGTMREETIRIPIPQPEPEDDPASGDEDSD